MPPSRIAGIASNAPTTAAIVERLEREVEEGSVADGEDLARRLRELLAESYDFVS